MSDPSKYAPVPGNIPGTAINLGGRDLILAPLNLDGVRAAEPLLKELDTLKKFEMQVPVAAQVIILSLNRNYPDMTIEDLVPLLDMSNTSKAVLAVAGIAGFEMLKPGETRPAAQ